jgi:hypothetical protein
LALAVPVQAATFSFVKAGIKFDNFSHPALTTAPTTSTNTLVVLEGGSTIAISNAEATFISGLEPDTETKAFNLINSSAEGNGSNYLGLAQIVASLVGGFELGAQENFSFSFNGFLTLATSIDDDTYESAFALGRLSFELFGETAYQPTTLLDRFDLFATLETPGDNDILKFLITSNSGNLGLDFFQRQTGEFDEFLTLKFSGNYSRTFAEPTLVSLVENKTGGAEVQAVPTPNLLWGLMTYGGLGFFGKLRRRPTSP